MNLRILSTVAIGLTVFTAFADTIIFHDGSSKNVSDIEIGEKSIIYNEITNGQTVTKRIAKSEVFAVKIGNEPLKTIYSQSSGQTETSQNSSPKQQMSGKIDPIPASDNASIIDKYNKETPIHKDKKIGGVTSDVLIYYGISDKSIMSTNDVEILIKHVPSKEKFKDTYFWERQQYLIGIKNKTDRPIYIDLANTFKTQLDGSSKPWFDGTTYTESSGSGSGGSLGLGAVAGALGIGGVVGTLANGISVGGGSNNGATMSKGIQRIMAIAPNSIGYLPEHPYVNDKKIEYKPEDFYDISPSGEKSKWDIHKWEVRNYNQYNAPLSMAYYITISDMPDFSSYYTLPVILYSRVTYGLPWGEYFNTNPKKKDDPWVVQDYENFIFGKYNLQK